MDSMKELIEECLKDMLSAEKQLVKALPKLSKAAQNPKLKEAIETHTAETQEQIKLLEGCLKEMGIKPGGVFCKGMAGLIEEVTEHLKEAKPGPVADAMIVGLAQKAEHYEICGYGTVFEYMKAAGMNDEVEKLKPIMAQEEKTDKLLSQMAEREINRQAVEAPAPEPKKTTRSSASSNGRAKSDGKASTAKSKSNKSTREKVSVR